MVSQLSTCLLCEVAIPRAIEHCQEHSRRRLSVQDILKKTGYLGAPPCIPHLNHDRILRRHFHIWSSGPKRFGQVGQTQRSEALVMWNKPNWRSAGCHYSRGVICSTFGAYTRSRNESAIVKRYQPIVCRLLQPCNKTRHADQQSPRGGGEPRQFNSE